MPELPGIKRCVNGSDEMIAAIQTVENLEQLQSVIKNNITLVGKIRSFCTRENITSMMAVIKDIGKMWQEFADLDDDSGMEFAKFQDFMWDLVNDSVQRSFMGEMLVEYHAYMKAQKKMTRGEAIKPLYPDATIEIPDDLTLPNITYSVGDGGSVWKMNTIVCRGALMIIKRVKIVSDGRIMYEIVFQTETGEWTTAKIASEALLDSKKFISYCGSGIQVDANSMKAAMSYLSAFAQSNRSDIPTVQGTSHLGWNQDKILIDTQNPNLELIVEPHLQPTLKAVISKGTLLEWIENVFDIAMEDKTNGNFLLGLCSTLGSLLLEPLGLPNGWFVHLYGSSRSGKSTTMKAIASAIGCPINQGVWRSWDNTKVFIERYCHFMGSIGVFLDEAKSEQKNVIQETVYMIANGMGKGRGTVGGVAQTLTWKLNVVSTGEFDLKETANHEGFENRIISLTPKPGCSFFAKGNTTATTLEENVGRYYGTLIQIYAPLVEGLGAEEIFIRYKEAKDVLLQRLDEGDMGSGKVHTFVGYFAIMLVALDLFLGKVLCLELDQWGPYLKVFLDEFDSFLDCIVDTQEDRSERVLNVITSLIFSNTGKFFDINRGDNREPPTGFWGKIIANDRNSITVGIKPEIVQDQLKRFGYSVSEFERMAEQNGCLIKNEKHFKNTFRLNGGQIWGYKLKLNISDDNAPTT